MSTRLPLPDGRVISVPDDLTADEVEIIIQQEMGTAEPPKKVEPKERTPKDWGEAGSLALESLGKTAGDIGYAATHGPETAAAMDAAFNASAKRFGADPLGTAWGGIKGAAQGIKEGARTGLVTATGLVGSIPGAPLLEQALGGDPEALQQHIDEAKRNIAYRPIGTALDVAGIVPGAAMAGREAVAAGRGTGRLLSGEAAAERLMNAGVTPELRMRQAQYGPGATTFDVQPPEPRERALSYVGALPSSEVDPLREALRRRGKLLGTRHQADVERAGNLPEGALLRPGEHTQAVVGRSRAAQEQYAEQATLQRDRAHRAQQEAAREREANLRTERNDLYKSAFAQNADMPMDDFRDILGTKIAKDIVDKFGEADETFRATRGYGMGNLEILDKLELQLTREGEAMGIGTSGGRARVELAQQIRDRLATKDIPDYHGARGALETHARVANAPEPSGPPARRVLMPQPARDALARLTRNARSTEQFAKPGVAKRLRDDMGADIRRAVPEHLRADIIQGGTNRERAFEEMRRTLPEGIEPGTWNAVKRHILSYLGVGGIGGAAAMHAVGLPWWASTGVGASSALLGTGAAIARARRRQIGRRMLTRTMEELPEPEPFVDVNIPPTLLGRGRTP